VGRLSFTLKLLRPVTYGSSDLALSSYLPPGRLYTTTRY
jgi:hypothetical protein